MTRTTSSRRLPAVLAAIVLTASLVMTWTPAALAAPGITLTAEAPDRVLAGEPIRFRLAATNPAGGEPEYNLSFRDELPVGVRYAAGSTSPAAFGEPSIVTAPDGHQVLIWRNVVDLPVGATQELSFTAVPDPARYPVGSQVSTSASGHASTNPRLVPRFDAAGTHLPRAEEQQAHSGPTTTTLTAVEVTKSEPSPERELVRGVHDNSTVFTLRVRNTGVAATDDGVLVDHLPAGLEFLGCGTVDNSTAREYPGAPSLDVVGDLSPCVQPASVLTVLDPGGLPAGVYTRVEWHLGTLAAGSEQTVRYRAGIPQRANTMTFPGGAPSPESLGQQANLDNNTGPSTRETAEEVALTNHARILGTYTGPVVDGASSSVSDETNHTVTAEDLALHKTVSPGVFRGGDIATYSLVVRSGQYTSGSDVVVTDLLPDGLCPLSSTTNHNPANPACAPVPGTDPTGADYANVQRRADGRFEITFTPVDLDPNGTVTITFQARMEAAYSTDNPTVSGDSFVNTASLTGTTTLRGDVDAPGPAGPLQVADLTRAVLESDAPQLTKFIQPDDGTRPQVCSADAADYVKVAADDPSVTFARGDRVCFLIRVTTSDRNLTRNATVTDFLPLGTTYEDGSATLTPGNTVPATLVEQSPLVWHLGAGSSDDRYVTAGGVFEVRFSAVVGTPPPGPAPDLVANLAKLQWENTAGEVSALRDEADLSLAADPPLALVKSAGRVSPEPVPDLPEGATVAGGSVIDYHLTLTHTGTAANRNDTPVLGPDAWDALPAGVTCTQVSAISDAGTCLAPGAPGYPDVGTGLTGRHVIVWDLPTSLTLAAGASHALGYRVALADELSVASTLANTARATGFQTRSNTGTLVRHTSTATDTHTLHSRATAVTKSVVTGIDEAGNNAADQAVNGEGLTYTYAVQVPAHATVYQGVLSDALPAGVVAATSPTTPATVSYRPDAAGDATAPLPAGFSLHTGTGTLTFPDTWTNATDTAQLFEVTLPARVTPTAGHNRAQTNTASFTSKLSVDGPQVPAQQASATVTVRRPNPTITKSADAENVTAGQTLTYTLTARNATGRPSLHDAFVVDCLPADLTYVAASATPALNAAITVGTGTDGNGCAVGTTRLEWSVGTLAPGAQAPLTYQAVVPADAGGGGSYLNTATLTGSSLHDDKQRATEADNPLEYAASTSTQEEVSLAGATLPSKVVERDTHTVGERARFSVTVNVPADINYYDAAVTDLLPAGLAASGLQTVGVDCRYADAPDETCAPPVTGTALTAAAVTGGTRVGWALGDVEATPRVRHVRITYTVPVADLPADVRAGTVLTNSATLHWNTSDGPTPTGVQGPWDQTSGPTTATTTVVEPQLTPAKSVTDSSPQPGDTFRYTVTATNATVNASAAYNVELVDTVPAGVLVDAATITGGGVLAGASATGGGTITWTVPGPLAPGAAVDFGYDARFTTPAPATTRENTVEITGYDSLPTGGRHYTGGTADATVTPALPHVSIEKVVLGDGLAYVGAPTTWQLTVTSDGAATAHGVDAVDTLPPNWQFVPGSQTVLLNGVAVTAPPVVTGSPQTLTWQDVGRLDPGQTMVITFQATPRQEATTTPGTGHTVEHINSAVPGAEDARGDTGSADGPYAGPADTAVAHLDRADLVLDKSHTADPVAGGQVSWTVAVRNDGPDPAVGPWTVTDTVPTGLTGATASGTGWTCSTVGQTITCTRTDGSPLAAGASLPPLTVTADVPAGTAAGTELTNSAKVTGRTFEARTTNNTDTDTVRVRTEADLALVKDLAGPVVAGQQTTWTVDVRNLGPSTSRGPITVTDTLPAGVEYTSHTGAGWTCTPGPAGPGGQQVSCVLAGGLGVTTSAPQLSISALVPSGQDAAVVNEAAITSTTTPDPQPDNDGDRTSTIPATSADLDIAKTRVGGLVAGEPGTYRFTVANHGPSDARNVAVTDTLPAGLTFTGHNAVEGAWTCSATGQDLGCTLTGPLAAGDTATVTIDVRVDPGLTDPVQNTATVGSDTPDPVPGNNTDGDDSGIDVRADLRIGKQALGAAVAGRSLDYRVTAHNLGPSVSPGPVVVSDPMPAGVRATAATGTGWSCDVDPDLVVCTHPGDLGLGDAAPITVSTVLAPDVPAGPLTNTAVVDGPVDENPANNAGPATVPVAHEAEVRVTKSLAQGARAVAGAELDFVLQVVNDGPSDASAVVVSDLLPAGMTAVSISGTGWDCDLDTGSCTLAALAPGSAEPITVRARIDSGVPEGTTVTNTADVSTSTPGDDPADNSDEETVTVTALADVRIAKSHQGTAVAGRHLTFTVEVGNAGPSDAVAPVGFTDTLPAGMTFVSAEGGDWTCRPDGDDPARVECLSDTPITAGDDAEPVRLTVAIAPDADGTLTNEVALDPREDEVDTDQARSNNTDTDEVAVTQVADLAVTKSHTGTARIGGTLTFTVGVTNHGPSTARDVVLTDTLPTGLSFAGVEGGGWACTADGRQVRCQLGAPLAAGAAAEPVSITTTVDEAAHPAVRNTATVDGSAEDPVRGNNTATDTAAVEPLANLTLTKAHTGTAVVGGRLAYTLTVTNTGPTPAPAQVRVVDDLPAGLRFVSGGGQGWVCSAALPLGAPTGGEQVTCVREAGLDVGSSTITLVTSVGAAALPAVTNTARVYTDDTETSLADNAAADTATVTRPVPGAGGVAGAGTPGSGPAGTLPRTGGDVPPLLAAALLLIGAGWYLQRRSRPGRG